MALHSIHGEKIVFHPKKFNKGQIYGGLLFGLGWLLRALVQDHCLPKLVTGALIISIVVLSAIAGSRIYGYLLERLPH
jgi:hypothetical protein